MSIDITGVLTNGIFCPWFWIYVFWGIFWVGVVTGAFGLIRACPSVHPDLAAIMGSFCTVAKQPQNGSNGVC
jgi:hypothetical protein